MREIFDDVRAGEQIWIDDGKIGGVIEAVQAAEIVVRITHARIRGEKLRADKGTNLSEQAAIQASSFHGMVLLEQANCDCWQVKKSRCNEG